MSHQAFLPHCWGRRVSTQFAQDLPDRCDSSTACRLCRLEPIILCPSSLSETSLYITQHDTLSYQHHTQLAHYIDFNSSTVVSSLVHQYYSSLIPVIWIHILYSTKSSDSIKLSLPNLLDVLLSYYSRLLHCSLSSS